MTNTTAENTTEEAVETAPTTPEGAKLDYIKVEDFSFNYTPEVRVLDKITMDIPEKQVTSFIGPSGCGKTTLLRNFNRMNDLIPGITHEGTIHIDGQEIFDKKLEVISLRKRIRMIFQKANPFPKSIYENVVYSLRVAGRNNKALLDEVVETSLRGAALWDEVKDRLHDSALGLSGGQMQRLSIAHAIANQPEVLLMDEPCSALDPIATAKIEELICKLKNKFTVIIVTHNMQQATRVSDQTAYFYLGKMIEMNATQEIFRNPSCEETERYISGKFG
ncbi:MAG: phosphate ABC transporter ATP-binding protein PstB [Verrucomicrobiales bacterium]|nr:phosphate ABC transporter ATP-binding protein PstB [Verrucomicrobiales bacterium]